MFQIFHKLTQGGGQHDIYKNSLNVLIQLLKKYNQKIICSSSSSGLLHTCLGITCCNTKFGAGHFLFDCT